MNAPEQMSRPISRASGCLPGFLATIAVVLISTGPAYAQDSPFTVPPPPGAPNVTWTFPPLVAACAAGDSVLTGTPARLRIIVQYVDVNGAPKAMVPPESIWVRVGHPSGVPRANDYPQITSDPGFVKVFADDSTDASGLTRITIASLSACGTMSVNLFVSNELRRSGALEIRSLDSNGDGVATGSDDPFACIVGLPPEMYVGDHLGHSHRQALHGTMVRRTNTCGTCAPGAVGTLGGSEISWSPDGKKLAFTIFRSPDAACAVHIVPYDPKDGNTPVQFSDPPFNNPGDDNHDYDPQWSPLGNAIIFDRADATLYSQGISPGSQLVLITTSSTGEPSQPGGDNFPALSPDGRWVAFGRKALDHGFQLWKIPIEGVLAGAQATQLTAPPTGDDEYPQWSADGQWIIYTHTTRPPDLHTRHVYKVNANGGAPVLVLGPVEEPYGMTAGISPDGVMLAAGVGDNGRSVTRVLPWGLPPQTTLQQAIVNFDEYATNSLSEGGDDHLPSPRFSPDGTRLALKSADPKHPTQRPQLWAARQNMSLPPRVTGIAGQTVNPATPVVDIEAFVGSFKSFTIGGFDVEGDALQWQTIGLRSDLGMAFDASSSPFPTFTWVPPASAGGHLFNVRFQCVAGDGGVGYAIARICVRNWYDGGAGCADYPPYQITDLFSDMASENAVYLTWTEPDHPNGNSVATRQLRYSVVPMNEATWELGTPVVPPPLALPPGSYQGYLVEGLSPSTQYYFGIKTQDRVGNWSLLSNVVAMGTMGGGGGGGFAAQRASGLASGRSVVGGGPAAADIATTSGKMSAEGAAKGGVEVAEAAEVRGPQAERGLAGVLGGVADPAVARPGQISTANAGLAVAMSRSDGTPVWSVYHLDSTETATLAEGDSAGIVHQVVNGMGGWATRSRAHLNGNSWRFSIRSLRAAGRVVFLGPFALQRAWGAVDASGLVPGQVLEVVAARHSRFGDVTGAVDMAGSYDLGLAVGDTLGLTYGPAADPTAAGQKWFLVVGPPSDPKSTAGLGRPGLDERNSLPTQFALRQNQPNPFSGRTTMRFELPRETHVRLDIFDAQGRLVRTVADHRFPAGFHGVDWDRRNAGGTSVAPGVYLYQIHAGSFLEQKKMVLLPR